MGGTQWHGQNIVIVHDQISLFLDKNGLKIERATMPIVYLYSGATDLGGIL